MTASTGPAVWRSLVGVLSALVRGDWTLFNHDHSSFSQGGPADATSLQGLAPSDFLRIDGSNSMSAPLDMAGNDIIAAGDVACSTATAGTVVSDLIQSSRPGTAESGGITRDLRVEQRRSPRWWLKNPAAAAYVNQGMAAAPTVTSNTAAASGDSIVRPLLTIDTAATTGSFCEVITAAFNYVRRCWSPTLCVPFRTALAPATNIRHWVGYSTLSLNASASPTTAHIAAIYYDTSVHGTAFWRAYTCNGAAATSTTTTAPYTANAEQMLRVEMESDASGAVVNFYLDDVRIASHSTTLPGNTTFMGFFSTLTTLTTAAVQQKVGTFTLIHT